MSSARDHLSDALHELAAASPQAPTPELGQRLRTAFQQHRRRRRLKRATVAACVTICIVIVAATLWMNRAAKPITAVENSRRAVQPSEKAPDQQIVVAPKTTKSADAPRVVVRSKPGAAVNAKKRTMVAQRNAPAQPAEAGDFVALPTFDPNIPPGLSRMVRMDLPGPDLQLMGYPVDGQLLNRHVLTDVLVGQDGMPYAVRLVKTSN